MSLVQVEGRMKDWNDENLEEARQTMDSFLNSLSVITGYPVHIGTGSYDYVIGTFEVPEDKVEQFENVVHETMWNVREVR